MQPCVRPLIPDDREAYARAFETLSPNTRYLRFAGPKPRLSSSELRYLVEVDHHNHEALLAYECETGRPVGVARFVRDRQDPHVAEAAITVLDAFQGRGIGPQMLDRLTERAAQLGVTTLRAEVLRANGRALRMLRQAGWRVVAAEGLMATLERRLGARPASSAAPAIAAAGGSSTGAISP
jgi:RimJ/RimL family protein N-acetyltransferase